MRTLPILLLMIVISCTKKKNDFFPVKAFLQSEVAKLDSGIFSIQKIITIDTLSDTTAINREEFKMLADDFLTIPDLTDGKYTDRYEKNERYDKDMDRVIFSYIPKDKDAEILRQDMIVLPVPGEEAKVESIYIERSTNNRDSSVMKRLLWTVGKEFRVTNMVSKENQPERVQTTTVKWE